MKAIAINTVRPLCPVAALAAEFNELAKAWDAVDLHSRQYAAIIDRMDAIHAEASYLTPTTETGAAFQLMLISMHVDRAGDADVKSYDRAERLQASQRLLFRAFQFLRGGADSIPQTKQHLMPDYLDPENILHAAIFTPTKGAGR